MTSRSLHLVAVLSMIACGPAEGPPPLRSPFALGPVSEIAEDLERFVPQRMQDARVPGAAVALLRSASVVWSRGFGVASTLTREPVTADTLFEVASNSKAVAAYAALGLVESGVLELDRPVGPYLDRPWARSPDGDAITLRHLLSHTAGLSNLFVGLRTDRKVWFPPGDHFSYSGHGYGYVQAVLEHVTGEPFDRFVSRSVLRDLGMESSSYAVTTELRPRVAHSHVPIPFLLVPFAVLFLLAWLVLWALARAGREWLGSRAPVARRASIAACGVATLGTAGLLGLEEPAMTLACLAAIAIVVLVGVVLVRSIRRLWDRDARRLPGAFVGAAISGVLLLLLLTRPIVPLPIRQIDFMAAGGLRATAADLGRFLGELIDPRHLAPETVARMRNPQVRVGDELSWGLGIGIQHGELGDAIWHWGMNPGAESLMVGVPGVGIGVVVLTNGGPPGAGLTLAREVAHRAIGGEHFGYWAEVPGAFLPASPDGDDGGASRRTPGRFRSLPRDADP